MARNSNLSPLTPEEEAEWAATSTATSTDLAKAEAKEKRELARQENLRLKEMSLQELMAEIAFGDAAEVLETDQWGPLLGDNKDTLVGTPFVIVKWEFHAGDFGEFVSLNVMTMDERRYIMNDGSTGIYAQLRQTSDKSGKMGGVACRKGLRKSEYMATVTVKGEEKEIPAATYYIDDSL